MKTILLIMFLSICGWAGKTERLDMDLLIKQMDNYAVKRSLSDAHLSYLVDHETTKIIKISPEKFKTLKKDLKFLKMMKDHFESQVIYFQNS